MPTPVPSWGMTKIGSDSNNFATTKQHIQKQLTAVIQLSEHNSEYLDPSEKAWIEFIIDAAIVMVSDGAQDTTFSKLPPSHRQTSSPGLSFRDSIDVTSDPAMNGLLAISRRLNSANSLLSCCYDRWLWFQSSPAAASASASTTAAVRPALEPDNGDLQELLGRRRRRQRRSRDEISHSVESTPQSPQRNNTISSGSSRVATTSNDGSDTSLLLVIDHTIEGWRRNAEAALNEATARLETGGNGLQASPIEQHFHDTGTCRRCMTKSEDPLARTGSDATVIHTCTSPKTASTQGIGMSPFRFSTQYDDTAYRTHVPTNYDRRSQGQRPLSQLSEGFPMVSTFQPTLHNSFEKEAIYANQQMIEEHKSNSHSARMDFYVAPNAPASSNLRPHLPSRPDSHATMIHALPKAASRTSFQSENSNHGHVVRSRGRRWLEQQADRAAATT